jgi:hypothetical protein
MIDLAPLFLSTLLNPNPKNEKKGGATARQINFFDGEFA